MNLGTRLIVLIFFIPFVNFSFSQITPNWITTANNTQGLCEGLEVNEIALDSAGNLYSAGWFNQVADMDPGPGTHNLYSAGGSDIFISKLDAAGNLVWAKRIGNSASEDANSITVDNNGNIVITGLFMGTVDFDPGVGTFNLVSTGSDIFVSRYTSSGDFLNAIKLGSTGADQGYSVRVDNNNDIIVSGSFESTVDFNPGAGTNNLISSGVGDIFLAKYDIAFNHIFSKKIGGASSENPFDMEIDQFNQPHIIGVFSGTCDFDPSAASFNLTSVGSWDVFFAKYDINGNLIWANGVGGSFVDDGNDLVIDNLGTVYITGTYWNTIDLNPGPGTANFTHAGTGDVFLARYRANGSYIGGVSLGSTNGDLGGGITLNNQNEIVITGNFQLTVDFNPGPSTINHTSLGVADIYIGIYDTAFNYVNSKTFGGVEIQRGSHVIVDQMDNIHLATHNAQLADYDPGPGVANIYVPPGPTQSVVAKYTSSIGYSWAKLFGKYQYSLVNDDEIREIIKDNSDNTFVAGMNSDTMDFDPGPGQTILAPYGSRDAFMAKYDSSGSIVWAKSIGGIGFDEATVIRLDSLSNIYLAGAISSTSDMDPGAGVQNLTANGSFDMFLAKYDSNGNYIWAKSMGGTGIDEVTDIQISSNGNINLVGYFSNTVDFDPGPGIFNLTSTGNRDIAIAEYDASGNLIWAQKVGSTLIEYSSRLILDSLDNLIVTGSFSGTADFDPGAAIVNLSSLGQTDIFIAKYATDGSYIWAKSIGSGGGDFGISVMLDPSGDIYATGTFAGPADFNPSASTFNLNSAGLKDIYLARYTNAGDFVWAKSYGGTSDDVIGQFKQDSNGDIYMSGYFVGTSDFDPSGSTYNLSSVAASRDIFISKYSNTGNFLWALSSGGTNNDAVNAMNIDANDQISVAGYYLGSSDLDVSNNVYVLNSWNAIDMFLAEYSPCAGSTVPDIPIVSSSATITCPNDSVLLSIVSGNLNDATNWYWYQNSCGLGPIGSGTSIYVTPSSSTTYYVRGEGSCVASGGSCASISITAADTQAPIPDVSPLPSINAQCDTVISVTPTAFDNCSGNIVASTTSPLFYNTEGTYNIIWTYSDGYGNSATQLQTVTIDDTASPTPDIASLGNVNAECNSTITVIPTATDNCIGTIIATTVDPLSYSTQGTYVITWSYDDGNGNSSSQLQTVTIDDTTSPVPDLPSLGSINAECNSTITVIPTATDNCVGIINATTLDPLNYSTQGNYIITWSYDDGNGNISTQTQDVIIDDVTNPIPTLTILSDTTAICSLTPNTPMSNDNCSGVLNGTSSVLFPITTVGLTVITWTYDDGNGNIATQTQNVNITPCLGIDENSSLNMVIYPNPNNGIFVLEIEPNFYLNFQIRIVDGLGRVVYRDIFSGQKQSFDFRHLRAGSYSVQIFNDTVSFSKIIIVAGEK